MEKTATFLLTGAALLVFIPAAANAQKHPSGTPSWSEMKFERTKMEREDLPTRDYDLDRERDKKRLGEAKTADGRELQLTKKEQIAVAAIQNALAAKEYGEAGRAITEALEGADTADSKYTFAALQLQLGYDTNDTALQDRAVDAVIASGAAPASQLPSLYRHQGTSALQSSDFAKAETAFASLVKLAANDAEAVMLLAEAKNRAGKADEALPLYERAVELQKASGKPVPAAWTKVIQALTAAAGNPGPGQS